MSPFEESILAKRIPELDPLKKLIGTMRQLQINVHGFSLIDEIPGKQPLTLVLHCENVPLSELGKKNPFRQGQFVESQAQYKREVREALLNAGWTQPEHHLVEADSQSVTIPIPVRKSLLEYFLLQEYGARKE